MKNYLPRTSIQKNVQYGNKGGDETSQVDMQSLLDQSQNNPETLAPDGVMQLQQTIGNKAVQRVIGSSRLPARPAQPMPLLPSLDGQIIYSGDFKSQILAQAQTPFSIGGSRGIGARNSNEGDTANLDQARQNVLNPIMQIYLAYEADNNISNMIKLHSKITQWLVEFWDHDNVRKAGLRTPGVRNILEKTTSLIEDKVRAETAKNGADSNEVDNVLASGEKKEKPGKKIKFFEEVGVPQGFYATLDKKQVKLFKQLYNALSRNEPAKVPGIIAALNAANIVGFSLIKGVFLTYFAGVAGIEHFQRAGYEASNEANAAYTDTEELQNRREQFEENLRGKTRSKVLSTGELAELTSYTGGGFGPHNSNLRNNTLSDNNSDPARSQRNKAQFDKSSMLVSALNKLPVYQGTAYRMQNNFAGFDEAVKPGGIYTDLGFTSAAKTLEGAEQGGASGGAGDAGALEVYMLIHSKSAATVTFFGISRETEVLFRPGTRFKVDAIWQHLNGKVPKAAPLEAQMILHRSGEWKEKRSYVRNKGNVMFKGKVRVVEMTEA